MKASMGDTQSPSGPLTSEAAGAKSLLGIAEHSLRSVAPAAFLHRLKPSGRKAVLRENRKELEERRPRGCIEGEKGG